MVQSGQPDVARSVATRAVRPFLGRISVLGRDLNDRNARCVRQGSRSRGIGPANGRPRGRWPPRLERGSAVDAPRATASRSSVEVAAECAEFL
jgi:hypothetical protein